MEPNGLGIWKVRPSPSAMRAWAGSPSIARPASAILPEVGRWLPARRSNIVVLPAPFGPTRPTISPARTAKDRPSTAASPPKRFTTAATSRSATESSGSGPDRAGEDRGSMA